MRVRHSAHRNCDGPIAFDFPAHQRDAHPDGAAHMAQIFSSRRRLSSRATGPLALAGALLISSSIFSAANAQSLGYAPAQPSAFPRGYVTDDAPPQDEDTLLTERLRRQVVNLDSREAPGTIIIDTGNTVLYYVLGGGRAV